MPENILIPLRSWALLVNYAEPQAQIPIECRAIQDPQRWEWRGELDQVEEYTPA